MIFMDIKLKFESEYSLNRVSSAKPTRFFFFVSAKMESGDWKSEKSQLVVQSIVPYKKSESRQNRVDFVGFQRHSKE
jgi:hypothetical protein